MIKRAIGGIALLYLYIIVYFFAFFFMLGAFAAVVNLTYRFLKFFGSL